MSKKPLTPWVICDYNLGKILCGHCDCMTGLGESCSYVASLLWAIEAGVKQRQSLTVTDKTCLLGVTTTCEIHNICTCKGHKLFEETTGLSQQEKHM